MSNFPFSLDSDIQLPRIDNNITDLGGDAINALRSAMMAVEAEIGVDVNGVPGTGASGTAGSIAARLNVSLQPDGTINPSILVGLINNINGLVNAQISPAAAIEESKLALTYSTASLYTLYTTLNSSIDILNGFLSLTGIKLEPHIDGTNYNHLLSAIQVDPISEFVKTNPGALPGPGSNVINRNTTNLDTLLQDINNDLVVHEKSDSSIGISATSGGTVPPANYAHVADGIYVNPDSFITIPQSNNNVQDVIDFIDNSSLLLLGSRIQNFYENGISNTSRSSSLIADGYGEPLVPPTPVTTYFLNVPPGPPATSPVDDFTHGDDVILFNPTSTQLSTFNFDAAFAQVSPGDLITVDYGTGVFLQFAVDSIKSIISGDGSVRTYAVRINGKNPVADGYAYARIDRALFHRNKFGVLATARAPNETTSYESLIITNPRSAIALGNGFNPSEFDSGHFNLYLTLLPNGDLSNIFNLPAIDVTGNQGTTPGAYTLDIIVDNINTAFRTPGFNYRFTAFEYEGQIGIASDPFNNAAFSIIGGAVDGYGNYTSSSNASYPNNVVDGYNLIDPLGFGIQAANVASPPVSTSYQSTAAAMFAPTLLFYPLKRNYFYANGVERDQLKSDPLILNNIEDINGDGYWPASIAQVNTFPSRVEVIYTVNLDLSQSGLAAGKTIVVQPLVPTTNTSTNVNYGRFIISNISFTNCPGPSGYTNITVYDAVHGAGMSPQPISSVGTLVNIYFSDDSVTFDQENIFDANANNYPYKRFFEIYVDGNGHTTSHERARFSLVTTSSNIATININDISPKLRGYTTNGNDKEIRLLISDYDFTTGIYFAQLGRWNPSSSTFTNLGEIVEGKKGIVTRIYDETNIDYIDFVFDANISILGFTNQTIDIQLFSSLELNQQFMLLATCQVNDSLKSISHLSDKRQFGNISEEQLSTSAKNYISATDKEIHENGIVRGFDIEEQGSNTISFSGGEAFVNGTLIQVNPQTITIPALLEALPVTVGGGPSTTSTVNVITWFVCVNNQGEIELVASTDYDPLGPFFSQYTAVNLDHLRLFYALNPNIATPAPYQIRGTYFADLVINQNDLVPIASVLATTTGSPAAVSSMLVVDARRYISNGYSGLAEPLTLGVGASFRSLISLNNWLIQFNELSSGTSSQANPISNKIIVKGHIDIDAPALMGFAFNTVYFEGDGGVFDVYVPTGFEITGNVHFNNLTFNYFYDPTVVYDPSAFIQLTGTFNVSTGNNIVTTTSSQVGILRVGSIVTFSSQLGTLYTITSVNSGAISLSTVYTGASNTIANGLFNKYSISDNINTGNGLIYVNVVATGRNIDVTNCKFNWVPTAAGTAPLFTATSSTGINRHSFINIELAQPSITAVTILQDVNISGNVFMEQSLATFLPSSFETVRAAISFVSTSTVNTLNAAGSGIKLINVSIKDNVCDKDQMIAIVPTYSTTTGTIANTFNATNVLIENNICGAISIFTQYDISFDINGTFTFSFLNFTLDKNNGLTIRNNNCKYITSTDSTGTDLAYAATSILPNTGPITIDNNTCSWIKLPLNVASAATPCIIKNNILNGYDTNFRKLYLNGTTTSLTNTAIELIIIGSSLTGPGSDNVLISNNWINAGVYTSPPAIFSYDIGIYTQHDADIGGNNIYNLISTITPLLNPIGIQVNSGFASARYSNIHNNKLFRGTTSWRSYIDVSLGSGAGSHIIVNNSFDQITPDGILSHTANSINGGIGLSNVHDNTNQVISTAISLLEHTYNYSASSDTFAFSSTGPAFSNPFVFIDTTNGINLSRYSQVPSGGNLVPTSTYTLISELANNGSPITANERVFSFTISLTDRLPPGVKILGASIGIWVDYLGTATFNTSFDGYNAFSLSLTTYNNNLTSGGSSAGITDVKNNITPNNVLPYVGVDSSYEFGEIYTLLVSSAPSTGSGYAVVTPATMTASTNYLIVNTPSSPSGEFFVTGNDYRINATLDVNYFRSGGTTTSDSLYIYFSPLLITYRW
jgi:hypothetical protein